MPLVTSKEMLLNAQKGHYAVGAFNAENMEMVKAILAAAEDPDRCYIEQVMPDKLAIDLEYVDRASLWNDILLIFSTFREIIVR